MSSSSYNQVNDLNSSLGEPDQAFVMLNVAVPPLDDLRVRQALAYATDRQKYINTLGNGLTKPSDGPFIKGSPYFGTTNYPGFDQAKAKALVAEYQAAKGPISFKFGIINTAKGRQQNELLQAMWKEVGITTEIQQVEQSPYILNAIVGNYQAQGWRQFNTSDPDGNFVWWHSSTALPVGKQALNFARNKDPQIDQALITGRTNPDPAARADAYKSIAARFGADIPYIWISPAVWIVAAGTKIQGVGARPGRHRPRHRPREHRRGDPIGDRPGSTPVERPRNHPPERRHLRPRRLPPFVRSVLLGLENYERPTV
jgi:ABC-type transport system substrate-binding protein